MSDSPTSAVHSFTFGVANAGVVLLHVLGVHLDPGVLDMAGLGVCCEAKEPEL